uniref:hemicentin-1-like n=1 Tax=Scatophagus argus TaxID=75038 RepID=UPI001ED81EFC|nr:hemicentin-1-like [Scatophagus argus]XP_046255918.1 hemicentin-1-like [Scatophagus argus]
MFVLIWLTLLFAVGSSNNTDSVECVSQPAEKSNSHVTGNIAAEEMTQDLTAVTQINNSTLTITPSPAHQGTNVTCKVTDSMTTEAVTTAKNPEITGNTAVKQGTTLTLTCTVASFPPSGITWRKPDLNISLSNEIGADLQNGTGTATLVICNATAGNSAQYICTAKHLNYTLTERVNVSVMLHPKILNSSGCINQTEVLICTCVSEGVPLPTIKWPTLENNTEYSVNTTVSNHTISSTIIITAEEQSDSVVECVSSNQNGEVKRNITIKTEEEEEKEEEDEAMKLLQMVTRLDIIIAFLIGALLSATICCLLQKCHRKKKQKTYGNRAGTLEMVTSHEDPMIDAGQAVEDDQAVGQEAAEAGGAAVVDKSDVEYSSLDFFLIQRQSPAEAGSTEETTETEYSEIKKEKAQAHGGDGEETKHCVPDEEEGEDAALYSTVMDVKGHSCLF